MDEPAQGVHRKVDQTVSYQRPPGSSSEWWQVSLTYQQTDDYPTVPNHPCQIELDQYVSSGEQLGFGEVTVTPVSGGANITVDPNGTFRGTRHVWWSGTEPNCSGVYSEEIEIPVPVMSWFAADDDGDPNHLQGSVPDSSDPNHTFSWNLTYG
jgi:hypothetical protein